MTDDESYNAMSKALLIDMSLAQLQSGTLSLWEAYELAWLSSAKYHTEREQERCANKVREWDLFPGTSFNSMVDALLQEQEPLGEPFTTVLHDNLCELYERDGQEPKP